MSKNISINAQKDFRLSNSRLWTLINIYLGRTLTNKEISETEIKVGST